MYTKTQFVNRTRRGNQAFQARFAQLRSDALMTLDAGDIPLPGESEARPAKGRPGDPMKHSSLYRLYHVAMRELKHRFDLQDHKGQPRSLSGPAIDAIRASLDAGTVRESQRLNSQMVLLTIAVSGGPFLGLLGTVVGVMITFAAIAAAGDVNVNAIAPGIAAALVATVAGLAVAIPALFGYNYLSIQVKNLSADMAVFNDELVTKLAETYSS
jgi:biopolymer transport protein ExbB